MNGPEIFDAYQSAKLKLAEYFDQSYLVFSVEDNRDVNWSVDSHSVYWTENDIEHDPENPEYSEEAILIAFKEDYSLYLVYSCTGDKYYAIFDNSKEVK